MHQTYLASYITISTVTSHLMILRRPDDWMIPGKDDQIVDIINLLYDLMTRYNFMTGDQLADERAYAPTLQSWKKVGT